MKTNPPVKAANSFKDLLDRLRIFWLVISLFIFSSCVSAKQYVPLPDLSQSVENTDQSRIFLLRPTSFGSAVEMKIKEGARTIGITGPNSFLVWDRAAGHASIVSEAENDDVLDLELEEGKTYYIQQHVRMGVMYARSELELLPDEEGFKKQAKCKKPKVVKAPKEKETNISKI